MLNTEKIFIILSSTGIKVLRSRPNLNSEIFFPLGLIEHQEVTDSKKYNSLIKPLLNKLPKSNIFLLISDEFIFKKEVSASYHDHFHAEKKLFISMLPFDEVKIAHTQISKKDGSEIIAVNKDLYQPFLDISRQENSQIKHIIPLSLGHTDQDSQPSYSSLVKNHSYELFKNYDLNSASHGIPERNIIKEIMHQEDLEEKTLRNKRLATLLLAFFVLLSVLILTILRNVNANKADVLNNSASKTPVLAPSTIPTLTPTPATYKQISELKAKILNGSKIAGQANKLKLIFTDSGLTNVETGNFETNAAQNISFAIANTVSASNSALLIDKTKALYPELIINQSATNSAEFDILVVIGNKSVLE